MATLKTIAAALKLIDTKKDNLKKAYHDLQSHSSLLSSSSSSSSLSWSQIDSHFTSLHNSLTHRFHLLESLESTHNPPPPTTRSQLVVPSSSSQTPSRSFPQPSHDRVDSVDDSVVTRPELRALCEKMDGKGLRKYVNENVKDRDAIRVELPGAIGVATNPGAMVLDAMEGFYETKMNSKGDKDPELCGIRRACVLLLEVLIEIGLSFDVEVKERAKKLGLEWKKKATLNGDNSLEALGLLNLIAAYKLENEFEKGELVDYFVVVARYRQGSLLCRAIGLGDKVCGKFY